MPPNSTRPWPRGSVSVPYAPRPAAGMISIRVRGSGKKKALYRETSSVVWWIGLYKDGCMWKMFRRCRRSTTVKDLQRIARGSVSPWGEGREQNVSVPSVEQSGQTHDCKRRTMLSRNFFRGKTGNYSSKTSTVKLKTLVSVSTTSSA